MFTRHISRRLAAYLDGQLKPAEAKQAEAHMAKCPRCRTECEEIRLGMAAIEELPLVETPEAIWFSIEASLAENQPRRRWAPVAAAWVAAALILFLSGMVFLRVSRPSSRWIETDANGRAVIRIGEIGSVDVGPNTRVRVVKDRPNEHRLALVRGEIRAKISAPPRLFFVDTASGTAVDLGCEYTLNTDERGFGLLRVTRGWVSFDRNGIESLVPAGASVRTMPEAGPGVPYFDDSTDKMKQALERFGVEKSTDDVLGTILAESRVRDTLTLWHLLSRVQGADRQHVFDRMVALTPLPVSVTREKAMQLDPRTLQHWREELAWTW
jgi:predicted anti-sigma-YlaC factor YlaD